MLVQLKTTATPDQLLLARVQSWEPPSILEVRRYSSQPSLPRLAMSLVQLFLCRKLILIAMFSLNPMFLLPRESLAPSLAPPPSPDQSPPPDCPRLLQSGLTLVLWAMIRPARRMKCAGHTSVSHPASASLALVARITESCVKVSCELLWCIT